MRRFADRVVMVTGGARGIGLATANAFLAEGARVVIADLNPAPDLGARACFFEADVSDPARVEELLRFVRDRFGQLDVLVCNAGRLYQSTTLTASERDWEQCIGVNLKSVWHCARAAHPLLAGSQGASIVTVASAHGLRSRRNSFPYSAAKGGLLALTRSLAVEYAPAIRVNAVIPGQVESARTEPYFDSFPDPAEARRRVLATFPLRRLGRPDDIARAILFLAGDDAAWITGTFLTVDGGRDAALPDLSDVEEPG